MVPAATPRSYYGLPVIKEPTWTPEIPFYFFFGGLAGASAGFAYVSGLRGDDEVARRAWAIALGGVVVSPALLISDLGQPKRFLNMLRVFKVTSPMSVGSWVLATAGPLTAVAAVNAWTGRLPRLAAAARPGAALLGLGLSTYTAALVADTAVPVWHEARGTLPYVFAGGSAASAGAAALVATASRPAAPARRLALAGAALELVSAQAMERSLGEVGEPYRRGAAGALSRAGQALTATGAGVIALRGQTRSGALAGGSMVLGGALLERWSIFRAGFQSARDPRHVVGPQRARVAEGRGHGAVRQAGRASAQPA